MQPTEWGSMEAAPAAEGVDATDDGGDDRSTHPPPAVAQASSGGVHGVSTCAGFGGGGNAASSGSSGVCLHVQLERKRDPGALPAKLAKDAAKLSLLTKRLHAAPDEASHYYERAAALLGMGLYSEVTRDADVCLKLDPSHAKARFAKGRALYFLGEYEAAFEQYEEGLRLAPHPRDMLLIC